MRPQPDEGPGGTRRHLLGPRAVPQGGRQIEWATAASPPGRLGQQSKTDAVVQ